MFRRGRTQDFTIRSYLMLWSVIRHSRSLFPELRRAMGWQHNQLGSLLCSAVQHGLATLSLGWASSYILQLVGLVTPLLGKINQVPSLGGA